MIKRIEISKEKALVVIDSFLIPKEGCDRELNSSFDIVTVIKNNQRLTITHNEDDGSYKIDYEPFKKKFITTKEHLVYTSVVKYAYFKPDVMSRVKEAFIVNDLELHVDTTLKMLHARPNKLHTACKTILVTVVSSLLTAAVCYGVYCLSNNPTLLKEMEIKKQAQDIGCDGHQGVKEYAYYLNINNIYTCNDGTTKLYEPNKKGLER